MLLITIFGVFQVAMSLVLDTGVNRGCDGHKILAEYQDNKREIYVLWMNHLTPDMYKEVMKNAKRGFQSAWDDLAQQTILSDAVLNARDIVKKSLDFNKAAQNLIDDASFESLPYDDQVQLLSMVSELNDGVAKFQSGVDASATNKENLLSRWDSRHEVDANAIEQFSERVKAEPSMLKSSVLKVMLDLKDEAWYKQDAYIDLLIAETDFQLEETKRIRWNANVRGPYEELSKYCSKKEICKTIANDYSDLLRIEADTDINTEGLKLYGMYGDDREVHHHFDYFFEVSNNKGGGAWPFLDKSKKYIVKPVGNHVYVDHVLKWLSNEQHNHDVSPMKCLLDDIDEKNTLLPLTLIALGTDPRLILYYVSNAIECFVYAQIERGEDPNTPVNGIIISSKNSGGFKFEVFEEGKIKETQEASDAASMIPKIEAWKTKKMDLNPSINGEFANHCVRPQKLHEAYYHGKQEWN